MFQKNDYVVYKKNVCIVKDIKHNTKNGKESYLLVPIDDNSLKIEINTIKETVYSIPIGRINGTIRIISIKRITSSKIFDMTWGKILCLPKKYPLKIEEIDINGRTKPIESKPK